MGWSFGWDTYTSLVNYIRKDIVLASPGARILAEAKTAAGRRYWLAVEWNRPDGRVEREVELFLIGGTNPRGYADVGWGYKSMSEHAGPYEYDCPLKVLDATGEEAEHDASGHAHEWRVKVREYHAKRRRGRALARSLAPGQGFAYDIGSGRPLSLRYLGRQGRLFIACDDGGTRYRFSPEKVVEVF